jgi:uncharacterized protein (TIGR02217 family)
VDRFPKLSTGAVAQYPAGRGSGFATRVFEFLDGSEQRMAQWREQGRRWQIRLDLVSEEELGAVAEFFRARRGGHAPFEFEDPWTGTVHGNCVFESGELALHHDGEGHGAAAFTVREIRE